MKKILVDANCYGQNCLYLKYGDDIFKTMNFYVNNEFEILRVTCTPLSSMLLT